MRVVFIHPDLGIGGAERLVVDAALALKSNGHSVRFLTSHHDTSHCFPETRDLNVTVVGDFWPRRIFGRFCYALCAYWRMIWLSLYLCFCSKWDYDLVFVDQISACVPFIRWFSRNRGVKVLFYCHFPDQLLTARATWMKKLYRRPLDTLEEWSTGKADYILVNSRFTETVFRGTFTSLEHVPISILYPCVSEAAFSGPSPSFPPDVVPPSRMGSFFLSLNRYERKKSIDLAVRALTDLRDLLSPAEFKRVHLVIAGGYDENLPENVQHYEELVRLADSQQLRDHVTFLKSPSDKVKRCLLEKCLALLYTPDKEHFGIVPVEAMYCSRPVVAARSGGPTESVVDEETGFLVSPENSKAFANRMKIFVENPNLANEYGRCGRKRALEKFSFDSFKVQLNDICKNLVSEEGEQLN